MTPAEMALGETDCDLDELMELLDGVADPRGDAIQDILPLAGSDLVPVHQASQQTRKRPISRETRRKQEVASLRAQVQALEAHLKSLRLSNAVEPQKTVWEAVAKRQRDASQRSMVENMKLHEELQMQMKITRSLEKLLRRRENSALASKWKNHTQPRVMTSSASVFQSIQANLAARPMAVDEWMRDCGLNQVREDLKSAQVRVGSAHGTFLEMLICRVFPFPFERVVQVFWDGLSAAHVELSTGVYGAVERSESHCLMRSNIVVNLRSLDAVVELYAVGNRVDHQDRVVVSIEFRMAMTGEGGNMPSFRNPETLGYFVIERDPSRLAPSTLIKSCLRSWPEVAVSSDLRYEVLVDLLIAAYHVNLQQLYQMVEDRLMQAPIGRLA